MLTKYIRAAMGRARYEILEDDGSFYGEIHGFDGVWAKPRPLKIAGTSWKKVWRAGSSLASPKIFRYLPLAVSLLR